MIENGFDAVIPDPIRAAEFYQKAHNKNNTDATFNLGLLYIGASDVFNIPIEEGIEYIKNSASRGNIKAKEYLIKTGIINHTNALSNVIR